MDHCDVMPPPRAVDGSPLGLAVTTDAAAAGPIVVRPRDASLAREAGAVVEWFGSHAAEVEHLLAAHGAILLRGFPISSTADFNALVGHYDGPANGYSAGATARSAIAGRVFEATRAPAHLHLTLHQEMAYLPNWPRKLAFYCHVAPASGGETIIGSVDQFEARIDPVFRQEVAERGVLYRRNFRAPDPDFPQELGTLHRTWSEAFYTDDPAEAEATIARMGMTATWEADGSLSSSYVAPGFITHPLTGRRRWFNQIQSQTMTRESLNDRWAAYSRHYADGRRRPYEVCFGDGGAIALERVMALQEVLRAVTTAFAWQTGDVMLIDNVETFHGRNPYTGHRDVQVALLEEGVQ